MLITEEKSVNAEDPRVVRTRRLLVDSLNELMGEKSFNSITVSEIANRATLNRVTFYAHFQDKYALLEYDLSNRVQSQLEATLGKNPQLSEEALRSLLEIVCSFLENAERHCPPPRGQMQGLMEKLLKQHIYEVLLHGLQQHPECKAKGNKKGAPSVQQTAMVTAWAIYGAAMQWSQQDKRQPVSEFTREILPLITTNLSPYLESSASKASPQRVAAGRGPSALLGASFRLAFSFS
ncbi:MAG TPA: TetR family transcriptional regulator [Anaerolineales bacterium]|nr:TetR family transcriptional regulator [Anaerolineales bacterium]HRQ91261.1 TetR family transcriptional regulator [Anaerolineales bacterium]